MKTHIINYIHERAQGQDSIRFMDIKGSYRQYTYSKFWEDIKKYASYYQDIGVKAGDVISILLPTCEEYLAAFFGANLIQAVPVSLYPPMSISGFEKWEERTKEMISSVESKFIVTDQKISIFCQKISKQLNIDLLITEELAEKTIMPKEFSLDKLSLEDLCFLQFSSGTTGTPKAVTITQRNALTNAHIIVDDLGLSAENFRCVSWLPLYHDMGLVGALLCSIIHGKDLTLIRPDHFIMKPHLWLKAMSDHKHTITVAPNFSYGLVQKRVTEQQLEGLDLSSLRVAICGAETVYKETMEKFVKHLAPAGLRDDVILPVYGMAEATLAATFSSRKRGMSFITVDRKKLENDLIEISEDGVEFCSVGRPLDTVELKVCSKITGKELGENKVGRVMIKGPSITKGYYKDTEKTRKTIIDEWLDTGDEGFIHNGELHICGRAKDIMIIRGKNYHPTVFEEKLFNIEGIRQGRAIVSSMPNSHTGTEEVVVLAEVKDAQTFNESYQRIKDEIQNILSQESLPIKDICLFKPGTLLKTSSGKLKRRETLRQWQSNELKRTEIISILKKAFNVFELYLRSFKNKKKANRKAS